MLDGARFGFITKRQPAGLENEADTEVQKNEFLKQPFDALCKLFQSPQNPHV